VLEIFNKPRFKYTELRAPVWITFHKKAQLHANMALGLEVNSVMTECKFMPSVWKA
jgi:hypothetical protein